MQSEPQASDRLSTPVYAKQRLMSATWQKNMQKTTDKPWKAGKQRLLTMLILTVARHALEGFPGPPESPILILIARNLNKRTQSLFFCTRKVAYELGTLSYWLNIPNERWGNRLFAVGRSFGLCIRCEGRIRIFCIGFGSRGRITQWGALALLLGGAGTAFRHCGRRSDCATWDVQALGRVSQCYCRQ